MTATDAVKIAQGFTRLLLLNCLVFLGFSVGFAALTVLSPDIHETLAYADKRKVMAVVYSLPAVTMLLLALHLTARSNAALRVGQGLLAPDSEADSGKVRGLFRPTSTLWPLFFMTALIIVINYIILIYAVDGGIF